MITSSHYRHKSPYRPSKQANHNRNRYSPTDKQSGTARKTHAGETPARASKQRRQSGQAITREEPRSVPPHAMIGGKQGGERGTHGIRGRQWDGQGQATGRGGKPTKGRSEQKKDGERFVPRPRLPFYLMGIDFSEAPTTRSTCSFAAFLVLKP